jgi:nitrate/TMAO reductase-like tetraheme cytochrome c subunit
MSEGVTELRAKRLAKVRDGGRCRICYRGDVWSLHSHHIKPKSLYPETEADVENLITLCLHCHLGIVHAGKISDGGDPDGNWRLWVFWCKWIIRMRFNKKTK